jgi:hypothetical protein
MEVTAGREVVAGIGIEVTAGIDVVTGISEVTAGMAADVTAGIEVTDVVVAIIGSAWSKRRRGLQLPLDLNSIFGLLHLATSSLHLLP